MWSQKDVIGFVGSTGLSTGPHLDYRLAKDGRFLNPMKETFRPGHPIKESHMREFRKSRNDMVAWLANDVPNQRKLEQTTSAVLKKNESEDHN